MVQLSHLYMTTGKTIALTRRTFGGKVMFLVFNTLSRFLIAFLPRSKYIFISWLQSQSTVIWEAKKIKSVTVFFFFLLWMINCDLYSAEIDKTQSSLFNILGFLASDEALRKKDVFVSSDRYLVYLSLPFHYSPSCFHSNTCGFQTQERKHGNLWL